MLHCYAFTRRAAAAVKRHLHLACRAGGRFCAAANQAAALRYLRLAAARNALAQRTTAHTAARESNAAPVFALLFLFFFFCMLFAHFFRTWGAA